MVYCDARTGCLIKTVCKHSVCRFLSWIWYLFSNVFLQTCHRGLPQTSHGVHPCDGSKISGFFSSYIYKLLSNGINKCTFRSLCVWNLTSFFRVSLTALFLEFWALDSLSLYQCTLLYFCKPSFKMGLGYVSSLFFNLSHFFIDLFSFYSSIISLIPFTFHTQKFPFQYWRKHIFYLP